MNKEYFESGVTFYRAKRYRNALEEFLQVSKDPSDDPDLAYYLGLCYANLEKHEEALSYLEQVVTTHDDILMVYQARLLLSYLYAVTKRYKLAEFELDELVKVGFESPQVYSILSYVSFSQRMIDKSIMYLEKAMELDPDNPNVLNSIGYITAEKGTDMDQAIAYCKKAVRMKNDYPAYLDSLGWACFKAGRMEEARVYLKKAYSLAKNNRIIAGHLKKVMDSEKGNDIKENR